MIAIVIEYAVLFCCVVLFALLGQFLVARACSRSIALSSSRMTLHVVAFIWFTVSVCKVIFSDVLPQVGDGIEHEFEAREIADAITHGHSLFEFASVGNRGYRFILGVFYAATYSPQLFVYVINGVLGFWAMLSTLELLCRETRIQRVPAYLLLATVGLPSCVFWTTDNMKEAGCLWGICMMLRCTVDRFDKHGQRSEFLLPLFGLLSVAFLRPHIAFAWLSAIAMANIASGKRFAYGVFLALAAVPLVIGSFWMLQVYNPSLADTFRDEGVVGGMNRYSNPSYRGGSEIRFLTGAPIPFVSGLLLMFLRPLPHECRSLVSMVAGVEIWLLTSLLAWNWMQFGSIAVQTRGRLLTTCLFGAFTSSFFMSFTYNMGLMCRHRVQVLPAVVVIATIPALIAMAHRIPREASPKAIRRLNWRHTSHAAADPDEYA